MEFREPVKFQIEFLFIRHLNLLGNGRLPLIVQDFQYTAPPLIFQHLHYVSSK
jgi:hypothetical protein